MKIFGKKPRRLLCALLSLAAVFAIAMLVSCGAAKLRSIEIDCGKTEYVAGESFDESSVVVNAVYSDGSKSTVTGWVIENAAELTAGEHTLTVTYEEDGVTVRGEIKINVAATEHTHVFSEDWVQGGEEHYHVCACGEKSEESAHTWKPKTEIVEESTCTTAGERILTCSVCSYQKKDVTAALGHDFSVMQNDEKHHWNKCSRCDETDSEEEHAFVLEIAGVRTQWFIGQTFSLDGTTATLRCDCGRAFGRDGGKHRTRLQRKGYGYVRQAFCAERSGILP